LDRTIDIDYKMELQKKLFGLFSKNFYNEKEIMDILNISYGELKSLTKTLLRDKEGYKSTDIVIRCMGGRLYAE
jgi:hypothetical protein